MATKKKAHDEVVAEEAADVPEAEGENVAAAEDAADAAVEESTSEVGVDDVGADGDAVGPAVHSIVTDSPVIPAPITPTTGPAAKHHRVLYENLVNGEAEAFAARARATYIEVTLAGGTVELAITFPDLPTDDAEE